MLLRFLIIFCFVGFISAQSSYEMGSPKVINIQTRDFAGDQNMGFIQGEKDLLYVGNVSGLLEFNGVSWKLITSNPAAPIHVLKKNEDGRIFVAGAGFIGYIKYSETGNTILENLGYLVPEKHQIKLVRQIIILNKKVYFIDDEVIMVYDGNSIEILKTPKGIQSASRFGSNIIINAHNGLNVLKSDTWHQLKGSERLSNAMMQGLFKDVEGDTIIVSSIDGLLKYKNRTLIRIDNPVSNFLVKEKSAGFIAKLNDNRIALGTLTGGALIINRDLTPYYRINESAGLENNYIRAFFQDNNYGLWLACDQGIAKISYPIQSTSFKHNEKKFNVILNINSYKDELYVLSLTEVLKLKPSSAEKLLSDKPYAELVPFLKETDGFASFNIDDKILYATLYGTIAYDGKSFERIDNLAARSFYQSKKYTGTIYIGHYRGISSIHFKDLGVESPKKLGQFNGQVRSIVEDDKGYLWFTTLANGVYRLQLDDKAKVIEERQFTTEDGLPDMNYNLVHNIESKKIVLTSRMGFYEFDYETESFTSSALFGSEFKDSPGLIYAFDYIDSTKVWFNNYSDQNTYLYQKDKTKNEGYKYASFYDANPLAATSIHQSATSDAVWVGGVDLVRIEPEATKLQHMKPHYTVISKMIIAEDSLLIEGAKFDTLVDRQITLKDRRVRFEVGATNYQSYKASQFQYFLEGQDENWSSWTDEYFKIYTNLEENDYTFKVRSRDMTNGYISQPEAIYFSVLPFWYETIWFKLLLAVLTILVIVYITNYFSKRKFVKRVHEIELQQQFEDEKNRAIIQEKERGLKAMIQAQENERGRIARDLHDGVVQQIGSVILKARNFVDKYSPKEKNKANTFLQDLENSNQELRNISHQMMPRALKDLGMISAISDMLENSLTYSKINYQFEHFNINSRFPERIEVTVYRITQELVNNIIKHSNANHVNVQLFKADNDIILIVEDDGVGIKTNKAEGIGLLNISSRVDMMQGTVNFEPSPNSGTLVTVKIPIVDGN